MLSETHGSTSRRAQEAVGKSVHAENMAGRSHRCSKAGSHIPRISGEENPAATGVDLRPSPYPEPDDSLAGRPLSPEFIYISDTRPLLTGGSDDSTFSRYLRSDGAQGNFRSGLTGARLCTGVRVEHRTERPEIELRVNSDCVPTRENARRHQDIHPACDATPPSGATWSAPCQKQRIIPASSLVSFWRSTATRVCKDLERSGLPGSKASNPQDDGYAGDRSEHHSALLSPYVRSTAPGLSRMWPILHRRSPADITRDNEQRSWFEPLTLTGPSPAMVKRCAIRRLRLLIPRAAPLNYIPLPTVWRDQWGVTAHNPPLVLRQMNPISAETLLQNPIIMDIFNHLRKMLRNNAPRPPIVSPAYGWDIAQLMVAANVAKQVATPGMPSIVDLVLEKTYSASPRLRVITDTLQINSLGSGCALPSTQRKMRVLLQQVADLSHGRQLYACTWDLEKSFFQVPIPDDIQGAFSFACLAPTGVLNISL